MSDRYDPPGRESARPFGEADGGTQGSGSIIPFEPFARKRAAGGDLVEATGLFSSSGLTAFNAGQMSLHGTFTPMIGVSETTEDPGEQHLIFSLAGLDFGMKAEYVQTVDRLPDVTPVPNVAYWIDGVINLRGQVTSVVDLRSFLGLDRQPVSPRTRLIASRVGELVIGLVVDGVSEMRGILPQMIQLQEAMRSVPAWIASYVNGLAAIGTRSVLLLDIERLLLSEKMHRYQSGN